MTKQTLNALARLAQNGDLLALEQLIAGCQHRIYALSRRMLGQLADAQDATQEILIKITTSLGTFRGDSEFMTWAHRIAANHLTSLLRAKASRQGTFELLAVDLDKGLRFGARQKAPAADEPLLAYEVFIECAQRMLHCLDSSTRMALVLVDICDLSNDEAAAVLEIGEDALRQRVSRARRELAAFLTGSCGLANPNAACHCLKQVPAALAIGSIQKACVTSPTQDVNDIAAELQVLNELARATKMLRALPELNAPEQLVTEIRKVLSSDRYRSLH